MFVLNHLALGSYIADTVREPLLVLDAEFRVMAANRAYYAAFPGSPMDIIERPLFEVTNRLWDNAELRRLLQEVLPQHREIENFPVDHPFSALGPRYFLLNACEILRPEEHEYLILLAIDDITERRAAEMALAQRTAELERSNQELEQFATIASHDLHEPLRKVRTYGDLILRAPVPLPPQQVCEHVERMVHAATRMQTLINELLALARLSSPQRIVPVDLNDTVHGVLVDLESAIAGGDAEVTVGTLPAVMGDATQLRQLFQNLVANALKFRRADVAPSIQIGATDSNGIAGSLVELYVRDNGIGFDSRYAKTIFEPLERLHGRTEYAGTGMGLALARRIVERHRGTISAHSVLGEGSTFSLTLPAARQRPAPLIAQYRHTQ